MAEIYAPNPVSVLPDVDQVYQAPRNPSALEVGTMAALQAGAEVVNALRERDNTIAQLNAAAEAIEPVDPVQANIYRKMAASTQAFIPHGTTTGQVGSSSRAAVGQSRAIQGDLLNNMIQFAQESNLMRQRQQDALQRISAETESRAQLEQMRAGIQKQLMELENDFLIGREDHRTANTRANQLISAAAQLDPELGQRVMAATAGDEDPRATIRKASEIIGNFDIESAMVRRRQQEFESELQSTYGRTLGGLTAEGDFYRANPDLRPQSTETPRVITVERDTGEEAMGGTPITEKVPTTWGVDAEGNPVLMELPVIRQRGATAPVVTDEADPVSDLFNRVLQGPAQQ